MTEAAALTQPTGARPAAGFWRRFRRQRLAVAAGVALVLIAAAAALAPVIAPYDPLAQDLRNVLQGPSAEHWLGTDAVGRDVLSRLLYAARVSLPAALLALAVALAIGVPSGLLMGYFGRGWDRLGMIGSDVILTFPGIILVIALVAVTGNSTVNAMVALGIVFSPNFTRLARGQVLALRRENFVLAAEQLGYSRARIIVRHLLPNAAPPLLVQSSLQLGFALLAQSGLSFIGVGVRPPYPAWGSMLADSMDYLSHSPLLVLPPGIAIAATVLAANLLGDGLRDSFGAGVAGGGLLTRPTRRPAVVGPAAAAGRTPATVPADPSPATLAAEPSPAALLELTDLTVGIGPAGATVLDRVSLRVAAGRTLALVGESGSGKSVTALAVMGLLPHPLRVYHGEARLAGTDLLRAPYRELARLRGNTLAMIFQDPLASLNPTMTVGAQLTETIRRHTPLRRAAARERAVELLERVEIPRAADRLAAYPHELSGGMAQRVMIAMAISAEPRLLIADEPTTALDVTVEAEILDLLRALQRDTGVGLLFVTHDMGVVADIADEAAVMYAGQIVEQAPVEQLFRAPGHPYSAALLDSVPTRHRNRDLMPTIPGSVPEPGQRPAGCRFAERCRHAAPECDAPQPLRHPGPGHAVRCRLADPPQPEVST